MNCPGKRKNYRLIFYNQYNKCFNAVCAVDVLAIISFTTQKNQIIINYLIVVNKIIDQQSKLKYLIKSTKSNVKETVK